jgi:hypothetical protein
MINRYDYYHQRICYSFHFAENRFNQLSSKYENLKKLEDYFKKVSLGQIPNNIFNSRSNPRISRFKMKGLKSAFMRSLGKKLIKEGDINDLSDDNDLSFRAREVYTIFKKNRMQNNPGHGPILKNILIKDKNSLAIELPIWMEVNKTFLTGHIDLIQFKNERIYVIDYKPEGNFIYSLPQVASYGLVFKELFSIEDIKCISFNQDSAWEYNPEILLNKVKSYLINQRISSRSWEKFFGL